MSFAGFANVFGFLGLLSMPVILLLHLLRFRTERFEVSSLELWAEFKAEVRGSRLQRIPLSLLLLVDLLIALLLTFAWAQPLLSVSRDVPQPVHSILLLDISMSMASGDDFPNRMEAALAQASELLESLRPIDRATVITFGEAATLIGDTRTLTLSDLMERLNHLRAIDRGWQGLPTALALSESVTRLDMPTTIHIFTDAAFPQPALGAPAALVSWHLVGESDANQAVLDLNVSQVGIDEWQVLARVGNFSQEPDVQEITLQVDEYEVERVRLDLAPSSSIVQIWTIPFRPESVSVRLLDTDDLTLDNVAAVGVPPQDRLQIALVSANPELPARALNSVPNIELTTLAPSEYVHGLPFDLVVFDGFLPDEWPAGNTVVLRPPLESSLLPPARLVEINDTPVPTEYPLLDGVDFGGVRWGYAYVLDEPLSESDVLLRAGDLPLIVGVPRREGDVYLLLVDLLSGNLTRHPAFPILLANLVSSAGQPLIPAAMQLGDELQLPDAADYPEIRMHTPSEQLLTIAGNDARLWKETYEPGLYHLELKQANGDIRLEALGINGGSLNEADIRPGDWSNERIVEQPAKTIEVEETIPLASWFLALAVICLLWEARLAWK